jgi:hypothetical protein
VITKRGFFFNDRSKVFEIKPGQFYEIEVPRLDADVRQRLEAGLKKDQPTLSGKAFDDELRTRAARYLQITSGLNAPR